MISVLYRTVSMKKARPMHKTWGEPERSRKPLTQLPVAAYFNFSRTAPKRTSPILNAGAFSADGAPSLPTKNRLLFFFIAFHCSASVVSSRRNTVILA